MGEGCMQVLKRRGLLRNLHVHERIMLKLQIKGERVLTESRAQDLKNWGGSLQSRQLIHSTRFSKGSGTWN